MRCVLIEQSIKIGLQKRPPSSIKSCSDIPFSSHSMSLLLTWRSIHWSMVEISLLFPREFCKEFELKAKLQGTRRVGRKGYGIGYGMFRTFSKAQDNDLVNMSSPNSLQSMRVWLAGNPTFFYRKHADTSSSWFSYSLQEDFFTDAPGTVSLKCAVKWKLVKIQT